MAADQVLMEKTGIYWKSPNATKSNITLHITISWIPALGR